MLYYLLHLHDASSGASALSSAGARCLLAGLTALVVVLAFGRWWIPFLRSRRALDAQSKGDSQVLDALHAHKADTPSFGGVAIFTGVFAGTVCWARLEDRGVLLVMGYAAALGVLGFFDDHRKLRTKRKGLSARGKFAWQMLLSASIGVYLYLDPLEVTASWAPAGAGTCLFLPVPREAFIQLGPAFILLVVCVTAGSTNAVNLTDGLDGLATGVSLIATVPLLVGAVVTGLPDAAASLGLPHVSGAAEVAVFLAALIGGGLAFLWFNGHPAEIFMGDTGALPLGGSLGLAAILCKQEVILCLAGGVLVAEALSVILQVGSYKLRKKRIFLCAPLHHHFQFKGWPETKVTMRFWIVGAILGLVCLALIGA